MKTNHKVLFDGQIYEKGEEIWDLGSLVCVGVENEIRHYQGLSVDKVKLPKYVASGSTCFMLDTTEIYRYHAPNSTWYKL